jgi:hypothetical protein
MKVLVTGSSGLIGSALVAQLKDCVKLVRREPSHPNETRWDPERAIIDEAALEGLDAVVHLAGENIAGRWDQEKKAKIRDSRIKGTALLSNALARLSQKPKVFVCASAVGYYGDRGDQILTEASPPGSGFLPEVCRLWEAATEPAAESGIRVVNLRIGIVLSSRGGALARMLTPFKLGLGGPIGSGQQYMSWIDLEDLIRIITHALKAESLCGPVNAVAPNPVTNAEFARALGRALSRPALLPLPAFAARLAFGQMADELLLASARVKPEKLLSSGFQFNYPDIDSSLRHILERWEMPPR